MLFGLAMDMLGLTLGYPLIMGLNAQRLAPSAHCCGSTGTSMFHGRKLLISAGTHGGDRLASGACSVAGARRQKSDTRGDDAPRSRFVSGLVMAIASGVLSCLPNIGLAYGTGDDPGSARSGRFACFCGRRCLADFLHLWRTCKYRLLLPADRSPPQPARIVCDGSHRQLVVVPGHGRHVDRQFLSLRNWSGTPGPQREHDRMADSYFRL